MVSAVGRIQRSVFRGAIGITPSSNFLLGRLKHVFLLFVLLNTEHWILHTVFAKDLGTRGVIYPIEEEDPIAIIQKKLKVMEDSGELKQRNLELQKKTRASVERPKPVEGIERASISQVFYYDPTYIVKVDLKDHQGRTFVKKGTKINPLETVTLSQTLVFFDGDDEEQLFWVQEQLTKSTEAKPIRLILINGGPLKLAEKLRVPVYFDQSGILTNKLGIKSVPAIVSQEALRLRIEEIKLPPSRELVIEGAYDNLRLL